MSSLTKQNDFAGWVWPAGRSLEDPVLGYWKNEHRFPYLKTAARELMGMTVTSVPAERVFGREPWQGCHFSNRNHVSDDPGTSPVGGL